MVTTPRSPAPAAPFFARVRQALPDFSPTERKLAQMVLDQPLNPAGYSASELAQLTGVSNATVTRFVRRLGFESYDEARRQARLDSTPSGVPLSVHVAEHAPTPMQLWQQVQENVAATVAQIPAPVMDAMASALNQAPQVFCMGLQQNHSLATHLRWQLRHGLGKRAFLVPDLGETVQDVLPRLDTHDLVVLFALHSTDPLLGEVAQAARTAGAKVLCITDLASTAPASDWLLRCHTSAYSRNQGGAERHVPPVFDTTAASALIYSLTAHAVQWNNQPFELI